VWRIGLTWWTSLERRCVHSGSNQTCATIRLMLVAMSLASVARLLRLSARRPSNGLRSPAEFSSRPTLVASSGASGQRTRPERQRALGSALSYNRMDLMLPDESGADDFLTNHLRAFRTDHPHRCAAWSRALAPPPATPQLGIEQARLRTRERWRVRYRCRPFSLRIELGQDALEPLGPRRQRVAIAIDRATHRAQDFGVFFGRQIRQGH
jgi:hypothetical protein